jgi:hypothetical protein
MHGKPTGSLEYLNCRAAAARLRVQACKAVHVSASVQLTQDAALCAAGAPAGSSLPAYTGPSAG